MKFKVLKEGIFLTPSTGHLEQIRPAKPVPVGSVIELPDRGAAAKTYLRFRQIEPVADDVAVTFTANS